MKIEMNEISIRDLVNEYYNDEETNAIYGYSGKLNIRPPYQREFVYKDKQRDEVIRTIQKDFPLNVMYWVKNEDGTYELLDGQQRTISICDYVNAGYSLDYKFFHNLTQEEKEKILNYKLMVYICEGSDKEKLDWFKIINIAGVQLTQQELRNAIYTGPWLSDAKKFFSKNNCPAQKMGSIYMTGSAIRQDYLKNVLDWISDGKIEDYMSKHQHDKNADELKDYFKNVIDWIKKVFPVERKNMNNTDWGYLYNNYKDVKFDQELFENRIKELMEDDDVSNQSGIYAYLITGAEKYLSIRAFDDKTKRKVYNAQNGICKKCNKHFDIKEMEADHITPWCEGGKTIIENCQMLCKDCNRRKSNK